jgi:RNA polymerase sigma factor for flagellar operon FliA
MTGNALEAGENGDVEARDALLREHASLVHHVARQMARALAKVADLDDLISAGTLGLINALETFEPERGLAFSTYAVPRIRGAILDDLRRQDHVPRSVRRKSRDLALAREQLSHALGRLPSEVEMAEHLGIDMPTLWRWRGDSEHLVRISLDRTFDDGDDSAPAFEAPSTDEPVDDLLTRMQETTHLQEALTRLRDQERKVLTLYYFEELRLHEIASLMGVTESRISQVRTRALARLREMLGQLRMPPALRVVCQH